MPFRTPEGAPRDLLSLIDGELRVRLEEAVDHACLDAMVSARRTAGAPMPVADDARDREEFTASVRIFLEHLRDEIPTDASEAARATPAAGPAVSEEWRLLTVQLALAKSLPDYWQRFEAVRLRFSADYPTLVHGGPATEDPQTPSRGPRRGVLGQLFGRS
jgi:hypothetical protein